jgi:hypothetical protein
MVGCLPEILSSPRADGSIGLEKVPQAQNGHAAGRYHRTESADERQAVATRRRHCLKEAASDIQAARELLAVQRKGMCHTDIGDTITLGGCHSLKGNVTIKIGRCPGTGSVGGTTSE